MLQYYVLNYDPNAHKVVQKNIFNNAYINRRTRQAVRKYIRAPSKFGFSYGGGKEVRGFPAFCKELRSVLMHELWGRREYEISVGDAFETDCEKLEKWDCFMQCEKNIETIARDVIFQYKQELKDKNEGPRVMSKACAISEKRFCEVKPHTTEVA